MKRRQRLAYAVIPIALLLALSGCGGDDGGDGNGVASLGGTPTASASSGAAAPADEGERALKFAQCMREQGIDMPDPEIDGGRISQRINARRGDNVEAAQEKCKQYAPSGGPGGKPDPKALESMLAHAKCMRDNGVEAFPDPDPDKGGIRINEAIANDPDFAAAQKKCDALMERPDSK
ncbi:hypothetical protein DFJ67_3137 [Asanoa ferruginea]|uniref:Lipoprotein n=1 Tax=Asanoa ferruginea TaxID=53367 RepID=A0A3D9ZTY1_9ACTN|nr:hypothetical protein [Asanoa ferruginea]REF97140.1 hypothetical protein DFJ67_3137 [Asanoa ferruginea]GIF50090.1 hypothetical protein Afe04nite_46290 [Asanoa ferruginea]